jgi:hypothetical protein
MFTRALHEPLALLRLPLLLVPVAPVLTVKPRLPAWPMCSWRSLPASCGAELHLRMAIGLTAPDGSLGFPELTLQLRCY